MGRIIDITSKLGFEENPKLKIRDEELEVNTDAESALKIMGYTGGGMTPQDIEEAVKTAFTPESYEKLKSMKLNFQDYQKVFEIAVDTIIGAKEEDPEGNAQTPDTI